MSWFFKNELPRTGGVGNNNPLFKNLLNEQELTALVAQVNELKISRGYKKYLKSHASGTLLTNQMGSGMDYAESRSYQAGDDPRFINWRLTARSNETCVKTFYTESSPTLCILMDRQSSMCFGTKVRLKVSQAVRVASLLSHVAIQYRLALSGMILDETTHWIPPNTKQQIFDNWLIQINAPCPPTCSPERVFQKTDWQSILQKLTLQNPQGSLIYLVSDFAGLSNKHQRYLEELQAHHHVIAVSISDPAEHTLSSNGVIRFKSLQTQQQYQVNSSVAKQQQKYQRVSQQHHESTKQLFKQRGIEYIEVSTVDESFASHLPLPLEAST